MSRRLGGVWDVGREFEAIAGHSEKWTVIKLGTDGWDGSLMIYLQA